MYTPIAHYVLRSAIRSCAPTGRYIVIKDNRGYSNMETYAICSDLLGSVSVYGFHTYA